MIKILDCTLRDGGYYNQWDFDPETAKTILESLNASGVDIIEVGYKSAKSEGYSGLFKFCNEDFIDFIDMSVMTSELAFMIDMKEFIQGGNINYKSLDSIIRPKQDSIFSWVRLAAYYNSMPFAKDFIDYFQKKGYKVGFNLMGASLLSFQDIEKAVAITNTAKIEVFYIADSFGSFYPEDVKKYIAFLKEHVNTKIGIHLHDNQGMAYANAMEAINSGVDFMDATISGMGRGAGNLFLEQILLGLKEKLNYKHYKPENLLPVIQDHFIPLKNQYGWGYSYLYMLSGIKNIHPTYCQKLLEGKRYTGNQLSKILEEIEIDKRGSYNQEDLEKSLLKTIKNEQENINFPVHKVSSHEKILIVANGKNKNKHLKGLEKIISKGYITFEINTSGLFEENKNEIVIILNKLKLNNFIVEHHNYKGIVITGERSAKGSTGNIYHFPFGLDDLKVFPDKVLIPDYDAGMYAIAIAIACRPKEILLAGFDGFDDSDKNKTMDTFLSRANVLCGELDINISCATQTNYKNIKTKSLYSY